MDMNKLKYPIGGPNLKKEPTNEQINKYLQEMKEVPGELGEAVMDLSNEQLDTPYRPGGWTVRQVIHHLPDSHMNGYIRFKWTLTEEESLIKVYYEDRWAETVEAKSGPIIMSLKLLESVHARWIYLLERFTDEQWYKVYNHPETGKLSLKKALALYAWHGKHHIAHVTSLKKRNDW